MISTQSIKTVMSLEVQTKLKTLELSIHAQKNRSKERKFNNFLWAKLN